ncbi:MAG: DUF4330 domain-containing protein [Acidobacteriia bacterium]|nr:DUF4330 domain-containing protein [Terriglobia bacterium]
MNKYTVSIIDVLVGLAILMILAALFVPHFIPPKSSAAPARQPAPVTRPVH